MCPIILRNKKKLKKRMICCNKNIQTDHLILQCVMMYLPLCDCSATLTFPLYCACVWRRIFQSEYSHSAVKLTRNTLNE